MSKQTFTTSAIDNLINESVAEADKLKNELTTINNDNLDINFQDTEYDDYLPENDKTFSEKKDVVNSETGDSVAYGYIYKKIGDLVDTGNASLQMLQSIDPDVTDPSLLAAAASLINSIKGCLSEYTKIHQQWVRFQQALKFEQVKFDNRKKIIKYKKDLATGQGEGEVAATDLFEVSSSELVEFLQWKKEKELLEKEKDEKI